MSESAEEPLDELGYIRTVIVGAGQAGLAMGHTFERGWSAKVSSTRPGLDSRSSQTLA